MGSRRAAFITIGQSPRPDILDEMRPWFSTANGSLEIEERGALDGLRREEIESLAPDDGEERLVSRLRDGTEVLLGAGFVHHRVCELVDDLDSRGFDILVLLCTGKFPGLASRGILVKAQPVVDHGLAAFSESASAIGVLVPHESQARNFADRRFLVSHASPYSGNRWEQAATELAGADLVVMHCMGYSEAMRERVKNLTRKPVLLARRMLAAAVAQLL